MTDELTDQLRRYADALEDHLTSSQPAPVVPLPTRSRRRPLLAAAAAIVVAVAVSAFVVASDDDTSVPVRTDESHGKPTTTTTVVEDPTSTTVTVEEPSSSTSTPGQRATTVTVPGGDTTTTTSSSPREARVRGSADWPGRDPRGELFVGACPSNDTKVGCWSMRAAAVAADGTFDLTLPAMPSGTTWRIAAFVSVEQPHGCVFSCSWADAPLNVVRGEVLTVDANVDQTLALAVSARIVDVFVRDRNGDPFPSGTRTSDRYGGGVQATDMRCLNDARCPEDKVQMFRLAAAKDGATRLVVNPGVRYDFHGQALNMRSQGWTDPQWTNNGDEFWFSPDEVLSGAELDEGHVFRVDGAPS